MRKTLSVFLIVLFSIFSATLAQKAFAATITVDPANIAKGGTTTIGITEIPTSNDKYKVSIFPHNGGNEWATLTFQTSSDFGACDEPEIKSSIFSPGYDTGGGAGMIWSLNREPNNTCSYYIKVTTPADFNCNPGTTDPTCTVEIRNLTTGEKSAGEFYVQQSGGGTTAPLDLDVADGPDGSPPFHSGKNEKIKVALKSIPPGVHNYKMVIGDKDGKGNLFTLSFTTRDGSAPRYTNLKWDAPWRDFDCAPFEQSALDCTVYFLVDNLNYNQSLPETVYSVNIFEDNNRAMPPETFTVVKKSDAASGLSISIDPPPPIEAGKEYSFILTGCADTSNGVRFHKFEGKTLADQGICEGGACGDFKGHYSGSPTGNSVPLSFEDDGTYLIRGWCGDDITKFAYTEISVNVPTPTPPPPRPPCKKGVKYNFNINNPYTEPAESTTDNAEIDFCTEYESAIGIISTDVTGFVRKLFAVLLSISGGLILLLLMYSGYQILTSQGNQDKLKEARERITSTIIGLLFLVLSLIILEIIGVDLLHIPGITG